MLLKCTWNALCMVTEITVDMLWSEYQYVFMFHGLNRLSLVVCGRNHTVKIRRSTVDLAGGARPPCPWLRPWLQLHRNIIIGRNWTLQPLSTESAKLKRKNGILWKGLVKKWVSREWKNEEVIDGKSGWYDMPRITWIREVKEIQESNELGYVRIS